MFESFQFCIAVLMFFIHSHFKTMEEFCFLLAINNFRRSVIRQMWWENFLILQVLTEGFTALCTDTITYLVFLC